MGNKSGTVQAAEVTRADTPEGHPAKKQFTAPNRVADYTLTFELLVNDGTIDSEPATVTVSVNADNDAPVAHPGVKRTVQPGQVVTLDGTASIDPEGQALNYRWVLTSGAGLTFEPKTDSTVTFMAPSAATALTFTLTVTESQGTSPLSHSATVTVTVDDRPPTPGVITGPDFSTTGAYTIAWASAARA